MSDQLEMDLQDEIWRPVKQTDGMYEVSNLGRVRSIKILAQTVRKGGSRQVTLTAACGRYTEGVGNMVAQAFLERRSQINRIRYKDGDNGNCHLNNLEWVEQ